MLPVRVFLVVSICMSFACARLGAAAPWEEGPAFSASPADLLKTSGQIPIRVGYAQQELLEDYRVVLDESGRRTARYRYIFRIDQDSAIEGWGTVRADYTTWLEERPVIRARVITPDGKEHTLDPATIGEFSPEHQSPDMFTDRRHLKAPLPKLAKGVIAEVEILHRDHRPFSRVGTMGQFALSQPVPVNRSRYTLEVPASSPFKWKIKGLPGMEPQTQTVGGRKVISLDLGPTLPRKKDEPNQAPDQNPPPALVYSTTPTWEAAAVEYSEIVESQLAGAQLGPWVRQATGDVTDRVDIIKRLVARMHKDIRYTGLEFGDASVVPRKPADTLKRGYGDCKDKSALLVALLREAGIPASLALLRAGSRQDIEPDMPGLSAFDHAIVHIPGSPALWIDPTVPSAPVGVLPAADMERRALVIGAPSPGLLTTPGTSADLNVLREIKEVFLADDGTGRVLETTQGQGPFEIQLRGEYLGVDPKRTRENLKAYAERTYKAKDLGRLEYLRPEDLGLPFQLILEAQKVGIANTGTSDAAVAMNAWPLVNSLSNTLKAGSKDDAEESDTAAPNDSQKPDAVVPRKTDLLMWAPYTMEAKWIIHPPTGYAHDSLPANQSLAFGPATLNLTYTGHPDGTVEALYRMVCPKRRWSPKEVDQARTDLKTFGDSKIPLVVFQQVGEAFLGAGQTKEALAEFRKQQVAAPGRAHPLIRLARAQLAAGLAETARDSLREAIHLEPTNSMAFQVQGWVLQHDWIGRRFKPGWDRKGAIEAYRRSIALDPKNRTSQHNLAILLEHNSEGERYVPGKDLDEAVRIYKVLIEEEKTDSLQDNLMVCLSRQQKWAEAQEVARSREASPRRNAWLVGMEACLNGLEKAKALGRSQFPDLTTRRATYLGAADVALTFRKYAEASALLNEGSSGASDMTQVKARAEVLARIQPHESITPDLKDPREVVKASFLALGDRKLTMERLGVFLSDAGLSPAQLRKAIDEQRKFAATSAKQGFSIPLMLDITLSLTEFTFEGDDHKGYTVQAQMPGQSPSKFYVARFGTTCRLVGNELPDLARQALWYLKRSDLGAARVWMDHLFEASRKPEEGEPLSGHVVRRLWEKGRQGTAEEIRLAAMCVLAMEKDEQEAMDAVRVALQSKLTAPQLGSVARSAALGASLRKDLVTREQATALLVSLFPDSISGLNRRIDYLAAAGKWKLALDTVESALAKHPDDPDLPSRKLYILHRLGQFAEAEALMADRIARGKANPGDFNNLAWWKVVKGKVDSETLNQARKAILGMGASSSPAHHTLATVLAEAGRTAEALEFLLKALGMRDEEDPTGADWYLLGRIAEQLGETTAAKSYYLRVKPDRGELDEGELGCPALAKRQLESLKLRAL